MDARTHAEAPAAAQHNVDTLQARHALDGAVIGYAAAEEQAQRETIAHLQIALRTSRRIGAAIGVVMAGRRATYDDAFDLLRTASQDSHRKLRDIAEDVLLTGEIPELRTSSHGTGKGNHAQSSSHPGDRTAVGQMAIKRTRSRRR